MAFSRPICYDRGFTLVELVMVLIILGVLSVSAIGLFGTRDGFTPAIIKNQFISSARLAQQAALARQSGGMVELIVEQTTDQVVFRVEQDGVVLNEQAVDRDGSDLRLSTTNFSAACSVLSQVSSFTLSFDGDGNTGFNARACVTGEVSYELCVAPTGYAHESACFL